MRLEKRKVWSPQHIILFLVLAVTVLMLIRSFASIAPENTTISVFQLCPGAVVDLDRMLIYLMSIEGGIDAVDLAQGTRAWSTKQASKPLALAGNLLICQAEPRGGANELRIVTLDTRQRGRALVIGTTNLPAGVNTSIGETPTSSFVAAARVSGPVAFISWVFSVRQLRGIPPDFPEVAGEKAPPERAAIEPSVTKGTLKMELSTGVISPAKSGEIPVVPTPWPPDLSLTERLARVPGSQFRSANNSHVLNSQRIADDSVWEKYSWTVYDHGTGERLGEFRTHLSFAPFFVMDSKAFYETGPYKLKSEKGLINEPLKIRAVDLRSGQELWNYRIRDTKYYGPFPS